MAAIMAQPDIDGALVGGASLDAGEFARICRYRELTRVVPTDRRRTLATRHPARDEKLQWLSGSLSS